MKTEPRLRRARSLVCFWEQREFVINNYLSGRRASVATELLAPLLDLDSYVEPTAIAARLGLGERGLALVARLRELDILVAEGSPLAERDELLDRTWSWGHDARALHFSTQGLRFEYDAEAEDRRLSQLVATDPPPVPYKDLAENGLALVPTLDREGDFWEALRRRRTRRLFRREPMTIADFSTVLQWTWGRTHELTSPLLGRYLLKTSPSGGARHSIEVYPLVLRVEGVPPGIYHYSVSRHDLELLHAGSFEQLAVDLCGAQGWVEDAASLFFMTALVERSMWKYSHSHAYRVLHLDAGHLGQTFHLVCAELGLAPFTTTATNAAGIEDALGLDGVSEIALYTAASGYPRTDSPV